MKNLPELPFLLDTSHEIPRWRSDTFWTKEPETLEWIRWFLQQGSQIANFIDVGANIGIYSLYAAVVNSNVKIVAVEPVGRTVQELNQNIQLNRFENRIEVVQSALSSTHALGRMVGGDDRIGSSGSQFVEGADSSGDTIHAIIGDQLIKDKTICGTIVKIDTDGNELDIIHGFEQSLAEKLIASILIETTEFNVLQIERYLHLNGLAEDHGFLSVEGHSNDRRIKAGNIERSKIYSIIGRPGISADE